MAYEPQPGTIPFRAIAWLRSMEKCRPGAKTSTADLCESIGVDSEGFTAYMATERRHGLAKAEHQRGTKVLLWSLGDGKPVDLEAREQDEPLQRAPTALDLSGVSGSPFPPAVPDPTFRAVKFDGKLLVTGMEIRDGVAIFEPHHIPLLKQHTDWWRSA
jgi:hypothetical protein